MKSCQLLDYLPEKRSEGRVKVKKAKKKEKYKQSRSLLQCKILLANNTSL